MEQLGHPGTTQGDDCAILSGTEAIELKAEIERLLRYVKFVSGFEIPQPLACQSDTALREVVASARAIMRDIDDQGEPYCSYCQGPWDEDHRRNWRHPS